MIIVLGAGHLQFPSNFRKKALYGVNNGLPIEVIQPCVPP